MGMFKFLNLFRGTSRGAAPSPEDNLFLRKYRAFRSLLAGNNDALAIMSDLENLFFDDKPFTLDFFISECERLAGDVYDICEDLNALSGGAYAELSEKSERMTIVILRELVRKRRFTSKAYALPLGEIDHERADDVGGKAANLGEVANKTGAPTPPGFAITAWASHVFLKKDRLGARIAELLKGLDPSDTARLLEVADKAREMVLAAELPQELEAAIREQVAAVMAASPGVRLAARSSATYEDSEASFAGQYSSILNVNPDEVAQAYKRVVASAWNPRAIFYRRMKGFKEDDVIMACLVVTMIDSAVSGVMYTIDPNAPDGRKGDDCERIVVCANYGLGVSVVDGAAASDRYELRKTDLRVVKREIAVKESMTVNLPGGGVRNRPVDEALEDRACAPDSLLVRLAEYGRELEEHYGRPLDVEWAADADGRLCILQARPLARAEDAFDLGSGQPAPDGAPPETKSCPAGVPPPVPGQTVMLSGGQTASPGAASGLAYVLASEHNLQAVPEGAILVAQHTSPALVAVMGRIKAIVTEFGSVTGHMSSVAREFHIPALVGTPEAMAAIPHGEEITVDAGGQRVYLGHVPELASERKKPNLMRGSPVYKLAQEAIGRIAPLNLLDPKAENFTPEGCKTLHDVIRYAHEKAMREMFALSDTAEAADEIDSAKGLTFRLRAGLPLDILLVDMGGGLELTDGESGARFVESSQVRSAPFNALLAGMTRPDVRWSGGVGVSVSGFAAIVAEGVFRDPMQAGRMGGPSYAIIAKEYLNFNARLGYHFATIDSFCGEHVNDNYVTFAFNGGAADMTRRARRASLITQILKRLGFRVETKGDSVRAEYRKYDCARTREKLDYLGRMLGAVRLLDMMLSDDSQVGWFVEEFMKGNYTFERAPAAI